MDNDYSSSDDQPMTLGQRMLRSRGITMVDDSDNAGGTPAASSGVGTPNAGATPNTAEPHENKPTAAASADSVAQSPSGKTSIGQRMVGASSSNLTSGIKAYNDDGSPAEPAVTGTDPKTGRPTIGIAPASSSASTTAAPSTTSVPDNLMPGINSTPAPKPGFGQRLAGLGAPPAAPQLDPNYSATQESVRKDSVVTPKIDPATGKTLNQYKPGFGTRLLRAVSDFTQGGIGGVLNGAINPKAPGFYGKGAVNNQYTKDEMARNARLDADNAAVKSMDDEYSQKEKGYGHQLTSYNDEARAAGQADLRDIQNQREQERTQHDKAIEDLRQQLTDAKDPETKLKAEVNARTKIGTELGLQGDELKRYSLYGDKSSMDDVNAAKAKNAEDALGIKRDQLAINQEKADTAKAKNASTFKDTPSIDKYSDQWYLKQRDQVRKEKSDALKNAGGDANKAQDDYKAIEASYGQRTAEFEKRKADWYNAVKSGKPVTVQNTDQGIPETAPSGPVAVPATKDSNGQTLAEIPAPIASVRTGAPAKPSPATSAPKSISKADVQALATKHGLSYGDAEKQFTGKGYSIQ